MSMFDMMPFERKHNLQVTNPFRDFESYTNALFGGMPVGAVRTDIQDKGDHYLLEADLPGVAKDDVHIDLDGDLMTITAERHSQKDEKDEAGNYIRCERSYGTYSRSFDVSTVKTDAIEAKYENGVLSLTLPKKDEAIPNTRRLEIK